MISLSKGFDHKYELMWMGNMNMTVSIFGFDGELND